MTILIVNYRFLKEENLKLLSLIFLKFSLMVAVFRSTAKANKKRLFFKKPTSLMSNKVNGRSLLK